MDFNDLAEGQRVARPVRTRSRRTLRGGHFRWCELEVKPVGHQIFGLGFDGGTMYVCMYTYIYIYIFIRVCVFYWFWDM